jgi:hypothetical protein
VAALDQSGTSVPVGSKPVLPLNGAAFGSLLCSSCPPGASYTVVTKARRVEPEAAAARPGFWESAASAR